MEPDDGDTKSLLHLKAEGDDTNELVTTEQTDSPGVTTAGISESPSSASNQASDTDVEGMSTVELDSDKKNSIPKVEIHR